MKFINYISGFLIIWTTMLSSQQLYAQDFGNEWIKSNQRYYKISTGADGIYQISYNDLVSAGIPINTINPSNLQLFHRGDEHAIHLELASAGVFQPGDFIEFYGKRNDGTLDSALYVTPEAQTNKHYNLTSDSTAYFLTWELGGTGKRMNSFYENNVLNLSSEPYHINRQMIAWTNNYSAGKYHFVGYNSDGGKVFVHLSTFDKGEGWTGTRFSQGQYRDIQFENLDQVVSGGPKPILKILVAGRNNLKHNITLEVGPSSSNLRQLQTSEFEAYRDTLIVDTLEWTDISNGELLCRVRVNNLGTTDQISLTYAEMEYADAMDHNSALQKVYTIPGTNSNRSYLEIGDVPLGSKLYDISDEANIEQIRYNVDGSGINAMIKNDVNGRKLLLTSDNKPLTGISPVSMRNIQEGANFIIISNKNLRKPTGNYTDPVEAYGAYRASNTGGSFDTLTIDIDVLYNMFSYGETTPLAIHQFVKYLSHHGDPGYIFIIGKGLTPNFDFYRKDFDSQLVKSLVPVAGYPGSDILYAAGLNGATHEAGIPIGRIASKNPEEVAAYLEKVIEKESVPYDNLWQKGLVHLTGGSNISEQSTFRRYARDLEFLAEGAFLGGDVKSIGKKGTGTTEQNTIPDDVNTGKLLLTFFGHSASGTTDLDIGYVSNPSLGYNNKGKYPFMIVNGCIAGDMYNTGDKGVLSFGEDWINTPDKGSIGFMAHASTGFYNSVDELSDLYVFSKVFYEVAFTDSLWMNKGIGDIQNETGKRYLQNLQRASDIAQVQQMALQGDPSMQIFGAEKPDYEVNQNNVFEKEETGQTINIFSDFKLGIVIKNFGRTYYDSIQVSITRSLEDGTTLQQDTLSINNVYYADTIYYDVVAQGIPSVGKNIFTVQVDPLNHVDELNKLNNTITYPLSILGDLTKNVSPYNYAIVNQQDITLVAQVLDVLGGGRSIKFELDTADQFNSPYRQSITLNDMIVAKWNVNLFENLPDRDTLSFYWRTQFEDQPIDSLKIWVNSSFTFIRGGNKGWAMNDFEQMKGNELESTVLNVESQTWEFEQFATRLRLKTFGENNPEYDREDVRLTIGSREYIFPPTYLCRDNTMNFVAFDKQDATGYLALGRQSILLQESCGLPNQIISNFRNTDIEGNPSFNLEKYVDAVKDGDFVLGFSIGGVTYENWPAATLSKLEEIGVDISVIQGLTAGEPVIILGKKGADPGEATIITADYTSDEPADKQEIFMDQTINGQAYLGKISSPKIGPSSDWVSFHQQTALSEVPQTDAWVFNIYGIDNANKEVLLVEQTQLAEVDLQIIDENVYPNLRLEMLVFDLVNLTPPQLKKWMVLYEGVPEGILTYKAEQPITGIEIKEGELQEAIFVFENVTDTAFPDSLLVEYGLFNQDTRQPFVDTILIKPVGGKESVEFALSLESLGKVGQNDFNVFVNPYTIKEQDYNNNSLNFPNFMTVEGDNTNPIMEVTVDGEFIMDGDIVAPSPLIVLRLKDDNKVLLKEDTLGVNLYLNQQCDNCQALRINFSSPNVVWTPATTEEDFEVEYQPDNLADGIYILKAEAADASGNASGTEPYAVNFEVINESQITNFFPYPNPFSSRTQFVFTLTGSDIPDDIIIQIMTVNGTVVREITMDEIGPIKIGHNKTEYAWDGRDEYGDQLANGVYLYQVKIFTNGKEMKHRPTSADRAFKNGFGKIYLLR